MKRAILLFFAFYILTAPVSAADDISVYLNGNELFFVQPPVIRNDRTLVPFRAIFEELSMQVEWDGGERRVTASKEGTEITLYIDNTEMTVNDKTTTLDTPPVIINDYTLVPLRAVSEAAGAQVGWDSTARTVTITTGSNETELERMAREVLYLTNQEREKNGLNPLVWDNSLAAAAAAHCSDMIERGFFHHNNPDGKTPFDRLKEANIDYWLAGENIAAGQQSPEDAVKDWMNSRTHRQNILNPSFKSLGVSVMKGGEHKIYWVQDFALLKE